MPAAFHWRPATAADQPFLALLYRSTRADLQAMAAPPELIDTLIAAQQRMQAAAYGQAHPHARELVLMAGGAPVGRLLLDAGPQADCVVDLAVLPDARGRGHASAALRHVQAEARAAGRTVVLSVTHDNAGARRLYQALGFTQTAADAVRAHLCWTG